jgi:hypothetical protein
MRLETKRELTYLTTSNVSTMLGANTLRSATRVQRSLKRRMDIRLVSREMGKLILTVVNLNRDRPVLPTVATTVWCQTHSNVYDVLGRYFTAGFVFKK